jgi:hypothetical protein
MTVHNDNIDCSNDDNGNGCFDDNGEEDVMMTKTVTCMRRLRKAEIYVFQHSFNE